MFLNLLAAEVDPALKDKKIPVGEAAIDALIGFCIVFIGIALLVFIVWGVGKIMQNASLGNGKGGRKTAPKAAEKPAIKTEKPEAVAPEKVANEDIDDETVAVIAAAIAAVYEAERRSCGFVVKRIKRM